MKTEATIKLAKQKYEADLAVIKERLEAITVWLDAASFMQNQELFIAQVKERDELRKREAEMDFKVRMTKWVLDEK